MNAKRFDWLRDIIAAIESVKIPYSDIFISDYSTDFRVTFRLDDQVPKTKSGGNKK